MKTSTRKKREADTQWQRNFRVREHVTQSGQHHHEKANKDSAWQQSRKLEGKNQSQQINRKWKNP